MSSERSNKIVKCPRCRKPTAWSESNKFKPFCSEYCKLIDLGEWASASYVIAGEPTDPGLSDLETPFSGDQPDS
ncbi:DNA gyrase inhibitor YacG [Methylocaldum marinum]|uniref:DNA gyrase inhibitor YacG n=1 Tax=Methylocaldum marinum TaxID=1432792 RepID=UPI000E6A0EC1|nr:DNA gyrase inhibitor YacG [Methylocaldum marinum]